MLNLKRVEGQSVLIGDDIIVRVISIINNEVKLGFLAPKNVRIVREEIVYHERFGDHRRDSATESKTT